MTTAHENREGAQRPGESEASEVTALKQDVGDLANAALERGWGFVDTARAQATDYASRRKDDAARSVGDLASAFRESGRTFEDRPNIRAVIDSAAEGLDQLSAAIGDRSFTDLYAEAETLARRNPAVAAATGALAGFLIARFVKASSDAIRRASGDVRDEVVRAAARPAPRRA